MSSFAVKAYKIKIEPHPDPETESLECARIGDFKVVVGKGQFKNEQLVLYIPKDSILPDYLIEEMGLVGKLAGADKNRVKAVRLRGQLSEGLVYSATNASLEEGVDYAELYDIKKYEVPIPTEMLGITEEAWGKTLKFDIENFKHYPDLFQPSDNIVITEKIHGTWCCIGLFRGEPTVCSKGLSNKGSRMKVNDSNKNNLYVKQFYKNEDKLKELSERFKSDSVYVLGEIYGKKIQDMEYGLDGREFRVFDIFIGEPSMGGYLSFRGLEEICQNVGFKLVPVLYEGSFSKDRVYDLANAKDNEGKSILADHIREGVVVKSFLERKDDEIGRMILKCTGEQYELRKNNNRTERQ